VWAIRTAAAAFAAAVLTFAPSTARAGTYFVYACSSYGNTAPSFAPQSTAGHLSPANECLQPGLGGGYRSLEINDLNRDAVLHGYGASWTAYSPSPAIAIVGAYTPPNTVYVDCKLAADGFAAAYAWQGGKQQINYVNGCNSSGFGWGNGISQGIPPSRSFGWGLICTASPSCTPSTNDLLGVDGIRLTADEETGPTLNAVPASNLWYANGWVRGSWPVALDASDPSGVCWLLAGVDGKLVASWADPNRDTSRFMQCHGSHLPAQLNTADYPDGQHTLAYGAYNAASVPSSTSKTVSIDNAPVSLTLSGPTDAPTTAGAQYIHANASAGPSGVGAIVCSIDGGPAQRYADSSAQVPVAGLGPHRVNCVAENNAVDVSGVSAISPIRAWDMTIREPTIAAISFTKLARRLRCRRVTERVRVPGRWVTVVFHHKRVRARLRGHWRKVRVIRCRARDVSQRKTAQRVAFGHGTRVSGWLGSTNGNALSGQLVRVLAAPDNRQNKYTQIAEARANPDGSWSARLPPGPSRLVTAVYEGSTTTEPVTSSPIKLTVPARIRIMRISPRRVRWGGTVRIEGFLAGGYLPPPPAGELVRLRIGIGSAYTTYGVKIDVTGSGRFRTTYTFGAGPASVRRDYWFQLQALPQDDYPYASADSAKTHVQVGG
jgi:hypothetical protein